MSEKKVFHIGVMVGNVHTQHPMELIQGVCEAAKTENVNISFFVGAQGNALDFWKMDNNDLYAYNYQYNALYDYSLIAGLDALIISYGTLCIYLEKDDREAFTQKYRSLPLVMTEEYDENSDDSFLMSDNFKSMYTIMDHLLDFHGYRKIVFLSGPRNNRDSNERERAYREAMKAYDLEVTEDMVEYGDYSSKVDHLVEKLLDAHPDTEAIVSANDEMALSIYNVCKSRNLRPGRDIAVTGYDDVKFAQRMDPPLTTANQDGLDMGYKALKCAVSLCENGKSQKYMLPAKFMRRVSCGCRGQRSEDGRELTDILKSIQDKNDTERIEAAVTLAVSNSYQSLALEETGEEKGREFFRTLIEILLDISDKKIKFQDKEITDKIMYQMHNLCSNDDNLDCSGFMRSFHQLIHYFMEKEKESDVLVQLGLILEIADNYITSYVMRSDEDRINMLLNKNWVAPASIRYMIDKVEDENEFNRLAMENVVAQGAQSAFLFLLPEPLECHREKAFECPEILHLAAEYKDGAINVYDKEKRPVITKEEGYGVHFPSDSKHNYVTFLLFAKKYQYGILVCEIDPSSIGLLYGVALQISTAKAYKQISEQENEAKRQLFETLRELKNKNQMLSFISSTDELTGLYNRRGFIENAVEEVNKHIGSHAAVFFSDLDHLKQINDEFGHKEGDFALKNAAEIMKKAFNDYRSEGTVCGRIGGDEFVSFMICENESDAGEVLDLLKKRCEEFNETCDKPYYVEFSTGSYIFVCEENYSIAEVSEKADECLYEEKKKRRPNVLKKG